MARSQHIQWVAIFSMLPITMGCANRTGFTSSRVLGKRILLVQTGTVATPEDFRIPEFDEIPPIPESDPNPSAPAIPGMDGTPAVPGPVVISAPATVPGPVVISAPATVPGPVVISAPATVPGPVVISAPATVPGPVVITAPATVPGPVVISAPATIPSQGAIPISTRNYCSNRYTNQASTNIIQSSGVVAKVFSVGRGGTHVEVPQPAANAAQVRQKLIDERSFTIDLSGQPTGKYDVLLCSADDTAGKCSARTAAMKLGDLNSSYTVEKRAGGKIVMTAKRPMDVILKTNPRGAQLVQLRGRSLATKGDPACDKTISPLVIDTLNPVESGAIRLSAPSKGLRFDMEGNGQKRQISWFTQPEKDCFLALPAGGAIHNIQQLFGDNTIGPDGKKAANGFEALSKFDSNKDQVIDADDQVFKNLRLWCDYVTVDGKVDQDELFTLEQKGMTAINLKYFSPAGGDEDIYGNQARQRSSILSKDGERMIFDIWFRPID